MPLLCCARKLDIVLGLEEIRPSGGGGCCQGAPGCRACWLSARPGGDPAKCWIVAAAPGCAHGLLDLMEERREEVGGKGKAWMCHGAWAAAGC